MRKFVVNQLYNLANAICLAADRLSPEDDSVWRERQQQRWLDDSLAEREEEVEVEEAQVEVAEPELLGTLLKWPRAKKPCRETGPVSGDECVKHVGHAGRHMTEMGTTWL